MRSLTLTGAAMLMGLLLAGCGAESGPTAVNGPSLAATQTRSVEPFTESIVNPCNGEQIVFSGEAITQVDRVGLHAVLQSSSSGTGTGPESGATYGYNLVFHESFNSPSATAPQANFFANANARVSSNPRGLSFTAHFVFHGVALPSGEFKVTRNVDRVECKG